MSKFWKRSAALLLACLMVVGMAACGSSGDSGNSGNSGASNDGGSSGASNDGGSGSTSGGGSSNNGEIVKLVVWGVGSANTEDCNEVAAAVSEITREKIGVEVELVRGQDAEQINLALTNGEEIDLLNYNNINGQLAAVVRNDYATPLDDLLEQYGQGAKGVINPLDLDACKFNGVLYALPNQKDTSRSAGFSMRKDIIDELGITVPEEGTYEDMHQILLKVHEAHPEMWPLVSTWGNGGMQETLGIDPMGDMLGVIEDAYGTDTTIVNFYATDTYRKFCEMMYQWNQEGLIMPDVTTNNENNLISGNGFAMFENWKPGKELENQKATGKEVVFMRVLKPYKYTDVPNGNSFIIPYSSKHPEKAMELWNLMFTDPEVSNLFINGIEGKHWVYTDDSKTFITTPEGVESNSSGYSSVDWSWPNQQLTPIWEGGDADLWEKLNAFNNSGSPSPAHGFSWNSNPVLNQVTACSNVVSQYHTALRWGQIDPATEIPKFVAELEAAGINDIIAEKQKQLDEFLANK